MEKSIGIGVLNWQGHKIDLGRDLLIPEIELLNWHINVDSAAMRRV